MSTAVYMALLSSVGSFAFYILGGLSHISYLRVMCYKF